MDAGRLDRRITLRRASSITNAFNEPVYAWADLATVAARVEPVNDTEHWRAGEGLAAKLTRFTLRYSTTVANVDPRDRVSYGGREYDIQGVKEIGRREFLEVTAAARAETP